jgi:1-deoxy-D-xylulose 5-phosphate reductoisomerase
MEMSAFLSLEDISNALPPYTEEVLAVDMDPVLRSAYDNLERDIKQALQDHPGNQSVISAGLNALLLYPDRPSAGTDTALPLDKLLRLDFRPADEARYPCLRLAREAMAAGGTAPAIFNAANEVAVAAFLKNQVPFLAIPRIIEHTLATVKVVEPGTLDQVLAVDAEARRVAQLSPT